MFIVEPLLISAVCDLLAGKKGKHAKPKSAQREPSLSESYEEDWYDEEEYGYEEDPAAYAYDMTAYTMPPVAATLPPASTHSGVRFCMLCARSCYPHLRMYY